MAQTKTGVQKLAARHVQSEDLNDNGSTERRLAKKRTAKIKKVAEQFCATPNTGLTPASKALDKRHVLVLSDDVQSTKAELETMVLSHSGITVQNPDPNTWVAIAGRMTIRVKNVISGGQTDVVTCDWLRNLPNTSQQVGLPPYDCFLAMKPSTQLEMYRRYDAYGDSYIEPATVQSLKDCFERMEQKQLVYPILTTTEMKTLDDQLFDGGNPYSYLRMCFLHIYPKSERLNIKVQVYGGNICPLDHPNITHIVIMDNVLMDDFRSYIQNVDSKSVFIVKDSWLVECFEKRKRVPEVEYSMELNA